MITTLEHNSFERQAIQKKLEDPTLDRFEQIQKFQPYFSDLTLEQRQIVGTVCQFPGSTAKQIGQMNGMSRYRSLQEAKRLDAILQYTEGEKPSSGAKSALYFDLIDGLTREVAEFLLNSIPPVQPNYPNSHKGMQKKPSITVIDCGIPSPNPLLPSKDDSNSLKASISDVDALLQSSPQGITAKAIERQLGCKKPTLNTWLRRLIEHNRARREEQPSGEFVYFPLSSPSTSNLESSSISVHTESDNTTNSNYSDLDRSAQLSTERISEANLQELLETIIDHLRDLENRMQSIEQMIHGKKVVRVEKIDAYITDRAKLNGKR